MNKFEKNYFNKATTKEKVMFTKYINFLRMEGVITQGLTICDIGCATGNFISQLGYTSNCYGIDSSKYAIDVCKKKFKTNQGHFAIADLNHEKTLPFGKKFDLITMFDVIEHIDNLADLKELLQGSLKSKGFLLITTPNANNFLRLLKRSWFTGEMDETHVNLFTPYTLDFFLRKTHFQKVALLTPYNFYFRNNWMTKSLLFGGQIFALYKTTK